MSRPAPVAVLFLAALSLIALAASRTHPARALSAAPAPSTGALSIWSDEQLTYNTGWRVADHPRLTGDFNRDGRTDLVGFGDQNVWVGLSTGSAFDFSVWTDVDFINDFDYHPDFTPRLVGDFVGDGADDVIGFHYNHIRTGESTGSAFDVDHWESLIFVYNVGWYVDRHPRLVGNFNGDGKDDIVGFGNDNVLVGLSTTADPNIDVWTSTQLTYNTGWRVDKHPRLVGDFNGDGRDDVIGFGDQNVWVGLSTGSGFDLSIWTSQEFTYNKGWRVERHPRLVGDFNGDGMDDVIGFGDQNVWVGLSTGSAFDLRIWTSQEFTYNKGWRVERHPRLVGDFNGDGTDDIVGFGDQNVWVGLSLDEAVYLPLLAQP